MGLLGFLKKEKAEPTLEPLPQEKPPTMKELMPKADIPPIEQIPLPPKPEEAKTETSTLSSKEEPKEPEKTPEKPPETSEFDTIVKEPEKEEALDFTLPDFDEEELTLEEELPVEEKVGAKEEPEPKIEPSTSRKEVVEGENFFLKGDECKNIFVIIDNTQEELLRTLDIFTKNENNNRNKIQLYKSFHDSLDVAQEKIMYIDDMLFEK